MEIAKTAFLEKIRRKELYIVSVIGVLIVIIFGTGSGSLSLGGRPLTDYSLLAPVMMLTVNTVCCVLSSIMSVSTIPNEYERKNSHLIWCRGISQRRYHLELAVANVMAGLVSEAILFSAIALFMISKSHTQELWKLIPAFLVMAINVVGVAVMTSAFSVVLPRIFAGALSVGITILGSFHGFLELVRDVLGGFAGGFFKVILKIIPSYSAVGTAAGNVIGGNAIKIHSLLAGILVIYIFTVVIMIVKKKEA